MVKFYKIQRFFVFLAIAVWGVSAFLLLKNSKVEEDGMVETFCENVTYNRRVEIGGMGELSLDDRASSSKKMILMEIAKKLNVKKYSINEDENGIVLYQNSKNGEVNLEIKNKDEKEYLKINVTLKDGFESIDSYRTVLEECFDDYGVNTDVTVNMKGAAIGNLTDVQRENLANRILESCGAKKVLDGNSDEAYIVYGYDKNYKNYVNIGKNKVNVNIIISYNEEDCLTEIQLASPITNNDF